jgi:nucleoside-diphosphate kinase
VHSTKPFYGELVEYITSGPVVVAVLEGPKVIEIARAMIGKTRPNEAVGGTIRGDLAVEGLRNLIHGSDAPETAAEEIALYFQNGEVLNYGRSIDHWVVG